MEHFQKFIYLLSLFLPIMVFFSLGLWFAWAKWFKHCKGFNEAMDEHHNLVDKLNLLYQKQANLSEEWEQLSDENILTQKESGVLNEENNSFESKAQDLRKQLDEMELERNKESKELSALKEENAVITRKFSKIVDETHGDTFSGIDIMEAILNDFADELVTIDSQLGIVFQEEPDDVDDLTEIDLLSPDISSKINILGIYRYRQIALWTNDQFDKILAKIGVDPNQVIGKNGIWQKHAAKLHEKRVTKL